MFGEIDRRNAVRSDGSRSEIHHHDPPGLELARIGGVYVGAGRFERYLDVVSRYMGQQSVDTLCGSLQPLMARPSKSL